MRGRNPVDKFVKSGISDDYYNSQNWLLHVVVVKEDNPPIKRRKLIIEGIDRIDAENYLKINKAMYLDNRSQHGRTAVVDDFDYQVHQHLASYEIKREQGIDLMNRAMKDTSKLVISANPYNGMWKQSAEVPYTGSYNNETWIKEMIARIIPQERQQEKEVTQSLRCL